MNAKLPLALLLLLVTVASAADIPNRLIDYGKFQAEVGEIGDLRSTYRVTELEKVIPSKGTRVRIGCNNHFLNAPQAFPSKLPSASLDVHTMSVLYACGDTNVYELAPLVDIRQSRLESDGELSTSRDRTGAP